VFCIGHSHLNCVVDAAAANGETLDFVSLWHFQDPIVSVDGLARLSPVLVDRLAGPVFSFISGNHDVMGLVQHPRCFDLVLPESPDLPVDAAATIVPYHAVRDSMKSLMYQHYLILRALRAEAAGPVFQVESPPPFPDGEVLNAAVDEVLKGWLGPSLIPDAADPIVPVIGRRPSNQYLRYKLWRAESDIMRSICTMKGMVFVPHPAESADDEGFLRREFWGDGGTHANELYGELVLRQLRELCGHARA
jgi:hypothetical protein